MIDHKSSFLWFFLFLLAISNLFLIYSQQTSNVDILSVTTIPTCDSILSSPEDQAQLCGPNGGQQQVADVLLNININEVQPGATSLIFNAFPYPGTTATSTNPMYPCGSTPNGQNCSTFTNPITVTWSTKPTVGAYQMKKIVSGIPLSYLLYQSPLVVDVDDQEMEWRRTPIQYESGSGDKGASACECAIYNLNVSTLGQTPTEDEKICSKCVFTAAGSFVRGIDNTQCQNSNNSLNLPACGPRQVDYFCSCGGFAQECAQTSSTCKFFQDNVLTNPGKFGNGACGNVWPVNPDINNLGENPCMCFPYNQADFENAGTNQINVFHSINLKQAGMHTSNAHNSLDQSCRNDGGMLKNDESVLNFNNHAIAACRKMAFFIASLDSTSYSQIEPFVKLNGICASYVDDYGCGNQPSFISEDTGTPLNSYTNCPTDQECWDAEYKLAQMNDLATCQSQTIFAEDDSCSRTRCASSDGKYSVDCGGDCNQGILSRFSGNAPLQSKYTATNAGFGDVCIACRADYLSSSYLPGNWGNQRKCKLFVDDWRDCYTGSYENAYFNFDNANQDIETSDVGFNYYNIKNPSTGDTQQFVLQPQLCMELLGKCNPATSGDTCWSSYNQPSDFFNNPYFPSQGGIQTQGFEFNSAINGQISASALNWPQLRRGLALTPFWTTPVSDGGSAGFGNGGHMWRCGHACDPDYANAYTSTTNNIFPTQDPSAIGSVKGMTGVGPLCTAYEVSLQGQLVSGVDFQFDYIDVNGNNVTETMSLSTTNIGGGSNYNTFNLGGTGPGTGVYGRIVNVNTPSQQTLPLLGGVLVVCGVDEDVNGPGSLNANMDVINQGFSAANPWQNLIWLLQQVEKLYPGVTGYFQGGCAVPIPTFVTALQCFSAATVCSAPPDLCQAIENTCAKLDNSPAFPDNCKNRGIHPYNIVPTPGSGNGNPSSWDAIQPGSSKADVTCNADASENSMGAAWYWLPQNNRNAFGKGFGQFGVNPWTDFTDQATGQSICSTSHTVNSGVPGVPGVTSNTNVDPSCSIIGNLARFHGQTSQYSKYFPSITKNSANNLNSICLSNVQQSLLSNNATINLDASCDANYFSTFSSSADVPTVGLPPNWVPNNPQMWVHQNFFMTSSAANIDTTLEVQLLISGYGLNTEVVSVQGGHFVAENSQCTLLQNSQAGQANLTVVNTGNAPAGYQVTLQTCVDDAGVNQAIGQPFQQITIDSGKYGIVEFTSITLSSTPNTKSLVCTFDLTPLINQNILLSTNQLTCVVLGFLQSSPQGKIGIDGTFIPPAPTSEDTSICGQQNSPKFLCWMIDGGIVSHIFFIILLSLIFICAIVIIVYGARTIDYVRRWQVSATQYNKAVGQYQEELQLSQEKTIETALKAVKTT